MKTEKLGNCCLIKGGYAFKSKLYQNNGIPIIRISNIIDERISFNNNTVYFKGNSEQLKDYKIKFGDILIALSGATTGKFGIFDSHKEALLNQRVGLLRTNEDKLINKYLFYFLFRIRNNIYNKAQGVAQPNLSNSDLEKTIIPLPTLSEQKQIAETLDKVDNLRQKRKQSIRLLDDYIKSVFYDMFGDPVKNNKKWDLKSIAEIIRHPTSNGLYIPIDRYSNDGIEMVHMSDGFYGKISRGNLKRVKLTENEIKKYRLTKNDVLIARRSLNFEGAAKICLVTENSEPLVFESSFIRVPLNINIVIPFYLFYFFNNEKAKEKYILKYITKSTISGINQTNLNKIKILVPPVEFQNEFAHIVENIELTKSKMEESLKEIDNLFNSLMQKYFK